jgi:hypothetical protein
MSSQKLIARLNDLKIKIATLKGAKERVEQQTSNLKLKLDTNISDAKIKKDAHLLLLAFISQRRESAIKSIEDMGTYALRAIYNDDRRLVFLKNEEKKSAAAFKMEIGIESTLNGKKIITGLKDERGGGVCESSSSALRIAAWEWAGYKGPDIYDEAWGAVSSDEKLDHVAKFLQKYVKVSNRQILFATHQINVFGEYADHIIRVSQKYGISTVH